MNYDRVAARLDDLRPVSVLAMPDGSLDRFHTLHDSAERIPDRDRFVELLADGQRSFRVRPRDTAPGGQAVNAARQCHALGDEVTLVGFFDGEFPFRAVRLGDPARVDVLEFEDWDLMLATDDPDIRGLDVEQVREAGGFAGDPDAVCLMNYASVPALPDLLRAVAEDPPPVTVVDPGPVTGIGRERAADLADAFGAVEGAVLSANGEELDALCAALDVSDPAALRERCRARAVVRHASESAAAVTAEDRHEVENVSVSETVTDIGGGDRFSAALARALAAEWGWPLSLALGNVCASYHVETGETGTAPVLRAYLR